MVSVGVAWVHAERAQYSALVAGSSKGEDG